MSNYKSYCSNCSWSSDYDEDGEPPDDNECPVCQAETLQYPEDGCED